MVTSKAISLNSHRTWKHYLPSYFKLSCFQFEIGRLQKDVRNLAESFSDIYETNDALCKNHPKLAETVQDHYEQVSLTGFNPDMAEKRFQTFKAMPVSSPKSKTDLYRLKTQPRLDEPRMDERNYDLPTDAYSGTYIENCVNQFEESPMRVRLVKLKPGKMVDFHIDYDPSFAMRIIVPVFTNDQVINYTKRGREIESVHMAADGCPWFLNTGFSHAAENRGKEDRIILMFSLTPSDLLVRISQAWKRGESELTSRPLYT